MGSIQHLWATLVRTCGTRMLLMFFALAGAAVLIAFVISAMSSPAPSSPAPSLPATPAPVQTAIPTAASTAAPPTAAPQSAAPAGLLPPTNLVIEDGGEPGAFIVHWDYPAEGPVVPEGFDVVVDGAVYEPTTYEGTDFEYSWYVGNQACGTAVEVEIVAVNGEQRSSSGAVPAQTGAC